MPLDREREARLERDLTRIRPSRSGSPSRLGKVTTPTASIGTGKFIRWNPVTVQGSEIEGGAASIEVLTGISHTGVLLGQGLSQNDLALFRFADYNWVTDGRGGSDCQGHNNNLSVTITGCNGCPVAGATVTFKLGGITVYSTTTDAFGIATYHEPPPGTYSITWSITAYGKTYSGNSFPSTVTINSGCNSGSAGMPFGGIAAGGGYTCYSNCALPLPQLYITDAAGTRPNGDCVMFNGRPVRVTATSSGTCGSPVWTFAMAWVEQVGGSTCDCSSIDSFTLPCFVMGCGGIRYATGVGTASASCADPLNVTGTYPTAAVAAQHNAPCGGSDFAVPPITGGYTLHT